MVWFAASVVVEWLRFRTGDLSLPIRILTLSICEYGIFGQWVNTNLCLGTWFVAMRAVCSCILLYAITHSHRGKCLVDSVPSSYKLPLANFQTLMVTSQAFQ